MTLQDYAWPAGEIDPTGIVRLRVQCVTWEADEIISVTLADPGGATLASWEPGAHLDVLLPSGLVRQYSLCGDPEDRHSYTFAVLKEEHGRGGSVELHRSALVGDQLAIRGPRNHFRLEAAERYLFIAGGIGITPILPMVRQVARGSAPWSLVYGGRSMSSMAFRSQLDCLPGDRVTLLPQDEVGHPDLDALFSGIDTATQVYCCGPAGLIEAVELRCKEKLPEDALHVERFTAAPVIPAADAGLGFEVELRRTGCTVRVEPGQTILDAIKDVGSGIMTSCEEGFCGTCETRVLEGVPEHHDTILSVPERERGKTMMICVGRARSERLVLDL
jgi:ferredoxin-NADP reductase